MRHFVFPLAIATLTLGCIVGCDPAYAPVAHDLAIAEEWDDEQFFDSEGFIDIRDDLDIGDSEEDSTADREDLGLDEDEDPEAFETGEDDEGTWDAADQDLDLQDPRPYFD